MKFGSAIKSLIAGRYADVVRVEKSGIETTLRVAGVIRDDKGMHFVV
jgi:hypothetical protein